MIVGSLVVIVLQLFLAPYIRVFAAVPNFLVAFTLAVAVVRPTSFSCILPFVLGLVFDFVGGGPVGAMAFTLTLVSTLASRLFQHVDNDSLFMAFAVMAASALLVEALYAVFILVLGSSVSFVDAFAYRVLPCFVYNVVISFIAYPIVARFARPRGALRAELTQLR